jgi:WD40 repeat protein
VLFTTLSFEGDDKDALLKSGPIRCVAVDNEYKYLVVCGDDKILKVWEMEGLNLLSQRYVTCISRISLTMCLDDAERSQKSRLISGLRVMLRLSSSVTSLAMSSGDSI